MKNKREAPNPNRNPFAKATKKTKKKPLNESKKTPQATHAKGFWLFLSFRFIPFRHGFVQWS